MGCAEYGEDVRPASQNAFALYLGTEANEPISQILHGTYNSGNIGVMVLISVT